MNNLVKINKETFNNKDFPILFIDSVSNNYYAILKNEEFNFKFAWYSDIEPVIKEITTGIFVLGIDQHFSILDLNHGNILLNLNLTFNFYDLEIFENFILIITELEILKINIKRLNIFETYPLPEYFDSLELKNNILIVNCINQEIINIEL
jgi:hypothetical protein